MITAREKIRWMPRAAKRFMLNFDNDCDLYESDISDLVTSSYQWVVSEDECTPLGVEVHRLLVANPDWADEP